MNTNIIEKNDYVFEKRQTVVGGKTEERFFCIDDKGRNLSEDIKTAYGYGYKSITGGLNALNFHHKKTTRKI